MALHKLLILLATAIIFTFSVSQAYTQTAPPPTTATTTTAIPVCGTGGSPGHWPWLATLTKNGTYVCGGTLISDQWVLTSAQCILKWNSSIIPVVSVGTSVSDSYYNSTTSQQVDGIICYAPEDYLPDDICMVHLPTPVTFNSDVQPVCLPAQNSSFYTGVSSWIAGWNSQASGYFTENSYYDLYMSVVGENECSCRRGSTVRNKTICAAANYYYSSLQSTGLPLMVQKNSNWILAGILTGGCSGGEPCVFTDVSKYQAYITSLSSRASILPSFIDFTSPGVDSDLNFDCFNSTTTRTTTPRGTTTPAPTKPDPTLCDSLFCSGHRMAPSFNQLLLCGLTLLLSVMG